MEVVGIIAAADTLTGTFLHGIKRLRKWYQTAKAFENTVDKDLLNATVQVTRLQIWGEKLEAASCPAAASELFPAILDRAQDLIGEIARVLELYTTDNESKDVPGDVKSLVKRFSKLEFKTKIKFATADHKRLQSFIGDLAEHVTFLHQLAAPDQRNIMALQLQNSIVHGTEDSAELLKIATIHQKFISQDIASSAAFKLSLLNQSWRQPQRLRKFEYETNDMSVIKDWNGKEIAELDSQQVLVEWRPESRVLSRKETTRRITDIVGLLHETNMTKPKTLLVPDCTGYIDRTDYGDEHRCVGIIYNYPRTLTTNQPYSLYEVLSRKEIRYREAPPLEIRQGIARSLALTIYQIHVTGWLHKGIRPHSLIFFDAKEKDPSLISIQAVQRLRLIGFDYSRPDTLDQKSEETDPAFDLYRHPDAQGSPRLRFCQEFDIYALGLVLFEIGCWERLEHQLEQYRQKYGNDGRAKLHEAMIRGGGPMRQLPFLMGSQYHDAVLTCLRVPLPVQGEVDQQSRPKMDLMVEILQKLS
ncbi:MAG: hypothetical protein L6R42_003179 [Xanthoria sp. 1 TBL-2021]|nr:MAG: hypothetical protein L6R42_003179 [Xanthoria sp. 1 TBL-2021]